jgi:hypothetical protein
VANAVTVDGRADGRLEVEVQLSIEEGRARRLGELARGERVSLFVSNALFLALAATLALLIPSGRSPSAVTVALLVAAYVCAYRLEFEINTGCAVPTQLVLVPMLFVLPLGYVPFAVAGSIGLACLIDVVRGLIAPAADPAAGRQ